MTVAGPEARMPGSVWGPLGSDFGIRLVSALVLFGIALLVVWLGGWPFAAWIVLACAVMAVEWERLTQLNISWSGVAIAVGTVAAATGLAVKALYPEALGALVAGAAIAGVHAHLTNRHRSWALTLPLYLGIPAIILVWQRNAPDGHLTVLWFLFVVWATDSWAMIVGRLVKGPLLAPVISPSKTWSGFFGGIAGAIGIGSVYAAVVGRAPDLGLIAAMIAISLIAQAGDVLESAIKRRFKAKDAGAAIPGHGGALDRLDSLLSATLALAVLRLVWPGFPFS